MKEKIFIGVITLMLSVTAFSAVNTSTQELNHKELNFNQSGTNNFNAGNNVDSTSKQSGVRQKVETDNLKMVQRGNNSTQYVNNAKISGKTYAHQKVKAKTATLKQSGSGNKQAINNLTIR